MFVVVKSMGTTTRILEIDPDATVADLKIEISKILNITPQQQLLIYKGLKLLDKITLREQEVIENSTIHILMTLI
jgi:hypothetical protein